MKHRILVVEDDHAIAQLLRFTLTNEGYDVTVARNAEAFREQAVSDSPNLIVLDIMLLDKNSIQVYEEMLIEGYDPQIPIVFLSASLKNFSVISVSSGKKFPALGKPFNNREFLALIRSALGILPEENERFTRSFRPAI